MGTNTRAQLALKSPHYGPLIFKCLFPECCNFFTSITQYSIKYCGIHTKSFSKGIKRNMRFRSSL